VIFLVWMVLIFTTVGMGTAAPVSLAAYFPLAPGATWTYRTHADGEVTMRVAGTQTVGGQVCRIVETVINGFVTQAECYRVVADGVYAYQRSYPSGTLVLTPPQPMLTAPVAVGRVWRWAGRIGEQQVTLDYTWARRESVATPAGTFDAMQLYSAGILAPDIQIQSWRWFARGTGMVKEDSTLTQGTAARRVYAELIRMTPGK
jgi:hypothetical protein